LKTGVNFQVSLKQNYATEVTIRPACVQKYDFASSPWAFAVSTAWQVGWAGRDTSRILAKSFDVT